MKPNKTKPAPVSSLSEEENETEDSVNMARSFDNNAVATTFSEKSEEKIWQEFKAGHRGAFTYIYQKYVNELFNYGRQFTTNRDLVKDCIQDLFTHIIRKKDSLGHTDSIKAYLFKSFRRRLVKMISKEKRLGSHYHDKGFEIEVSPELNFIRDQFSKQKSTLLEKHVNSLPVKQKEAILLYFYEGIPYHEIAEVLGMTKTKSARALLYRAIESLSKQLKPYKDILVSLVMFMYFKF